MSARFQAGDDLNARMAALLVRRVQMVADRVKDKGEGAAPAGKTWVSERDDRVRPSHESGDLDGVTVPANLRYKVPLPGLSTLDAGWELARAPRDPDLSIGNRIGPPNNNPFGCRCSSVPNPMVIRNRFYATPVTISGNRVTAEVGVRFPRIVESEYPDVPDAGGGWFRRVLDEVAATTQGVSRTPRPS